MFTLSDASSETKQLIKWSIIFLGALVLIFILIKLVFVVKDLLFPPPPEKPTMAFGKLPPQTFPINASDRKFSYNINTLSGSLPVFPNQAKVFRIQQNIPDLLAVNKMDKKARQIDFELGYTAITDKVYQWTSSSKSTELIKTLRANILTGDFTISSAYLTNSSILSGGNFRKTDDAISKANGLLASMDLLSDDLDLENIKTNLYSISNGTLVPASSISQTQIIEVYFIQKDVDKIHVIYDKPNKSNINILVAADAKKQIVAAEYVRHVVTEESATYLLKSTEQAFNELKNGNGYIASYTGNVDNISITDVTLSYYMTSLPQDFLMPVYVFSGSNNFYAYVSAITDESINK